MNTTMLHPFGVASTEEEAIMLNNFFIDVSYELSKLDVSIITHTKIIFKSLNVSFI